MRCACRDSVISISTDDPSLSLFAQESHVDLDEDDSSYESESDEDRDKSLLQLKVDDDFDFELDGDYAATLNSLDSPIQTQPIRLASWNIMKGYNEEEIQDLLVNGNISYISLQEPYAHSSHADSWIKRSAENMRGLSFDMIISKYNFVIIDRKTLSPKKTCERILLDGRIISHVFEVHQGRFLGVILIYAVCQGNGIYSNMGVDKKTLRREVTRQAENEITFMYGKFPDIALFVMGDLQEEISMSAYQARRTTGLNQDGVLGMLIQHDFRCPIFESLSENEHYHT